jgi:hypothetical protein
MLVTEQEVKKPYNLIPEYPRYTGTDLIEAVTVSVGNYRNYKSETLRNTPHHLKTFVEQYFVDADKHFERLMDVVIQIPKSFTAEVTDYSSIKLVHNDVSYFLNLRVDLDSKSIAESEFVLSLVKRTRFMESEKERLS